MKREKNIKKILFISDDDCLYFALSSWNYLYDFDYCSLTEFNLQVSRRSVYDGFVIHDHHLQEIGLIEEIAREEPLIPLLYVTSDEQHSLVAASKGADSVIIKENFTLELFHTLYQFTAARLEKERAETMRLERLNERLHERSEQCNILTYKVQTLEEELFSQKQNLEKLERMVSLGQMAAVLVHDFRNVLTALYGGVDMLKRRVEQENPISERIMKAFGLITDTIGIGKKMAQGLLDYAAERPDQVQEYVQINDVIEELSPLLSVCLGKSIQLSFHIDKNIPKIALSRNMLERALLNMATNARDAMMASDLAIFSLSTTHIIHNNAMKVALIVEDTGSGMSPDILKKACEPFFSTKPPGKGTGLGLAQVREFMEQCHGQLHIENGVEKGLKITLLFPCEGLNTSLQQDKIPHLFLKKEKRDAHKV